MSERLSEIKKEAQRGEDSALYHSTTLYIWLRWLRYGKAFFVGAPIVLSAIAAASVLSAFLGPFMTAAMVVAAGCFPALAEELGFNTSIKQVEEVASVHKTLQIEWRQLRNFASFDEEAAFLRLRELTDRAALAKAASLTPPEWAFTDAQKKIKAGHYTYDVDEATPPKLQGK